jgi:hypothetical protein
MGSVDRSGQAIEGFLQSQAAGAPSAKTGPTSISSKRLIVIKEGGEKYIQLVDKTEISTLNKIKAVFGYGPASKAAVAAEKAAVAEKFYQQILADKTLDIDVMLATNKLVLTLMDDATKKVYFNQKYVDMVHTISEKWLTIFHAKHFAYTEGLFDYAQEKLGKDPPIQLDKTKQLSGAFVAACLCADEGMMQSLLRLGVDINAPVIDKDGNAISPLMLACQEGNVEGMQLLLKMGAISDPKAVAFAQKEGKQEILDVLVGVEHLGLMKIKMAPSSPDFNAINSSQMRPVALLSQEDVKANTEIREVFLEKDDPQNPSSPPPVSTRSEFVPDSLPDHLMTQKQDLKIATKYKSGESITNGEGLLHQFFTVMGECWMTADATWGSLHTTLKGGMGRKVIISGQIHPDYEKSGANSVMSLLTKVEDTAKKGQLLNPDNFTIPTPEEKQDDGRRTDYDNSIVNDLVYRFTKAHRLPALSEIAENDRLTMADAVTTIEGLINKPSADISQQLQNKFVKGADGSVHSLEVLFASYVHQLRNELSQLEARATNGYIYTIDPPSIFANCFGQNVMERNIRDPNSIKLLNRMQILAFQHLAKNSPTKHLKLLGFNTTGDPKALELWQTALKPYGIEAVAKVPGIYKVIFNDKEVTQEEYAQIKTTDMQFCTAKYARHEPWALVLHNNSDGFGQNIENEDRLSGKAYKPSYKSLDALIGGVTNFSSVVRRARSDLTTHTFPPVSKTTRK